MSERYGRIERLLYEMSAPSERKDLGAIAALEDKTFAINLESKRLRTLVRAVLTCTSGSQARPPGSVKGLICIPRRA